MESDEHNLAQFSNIAILASMNAGDFLKKGFYSTFSFEEKSSCFDLVTEYDRKAEDIIFNMIHEVFPDHSFLGEESGLKGNVDSPYRWITDPLDGTYNFAKGLPSFAISIACTYKGKPIVGVCYDPLVDELFTAEKDNGAMMNGRKIRVNDNDDMKKACFSIGMSTSIAKLNELKINRRSGSSALDMCYVAKGSLDAYLEKELNPWDFAAAMLIIREAGGIVTNLNGESIDCTKKSSILASNPQVHKDVVKWISTE